MNKKIVLTGALAVLATGVAFASQNANPPNPTAKTNPSNMAYGCIGSGGDQFKGKQSCEGTIVGGCEGNSPGPAPSSATPCSGNGTCEGATPPCSGTCEGATPKTTPPCSGNGDDNGTCQGASSPSNGSNGTLVNPDGDGGSNGDSDSDQ